MKKVVSGIISTFLLVAVVACNNENKEETKSSSAQPSSTTTKDSKKTEISVGPGGAEVKTKDVGIKINTKDSTNK